MHPGAADIQRKDKLRLVRVVDACIAGRDCVAETGWADAHGAGGLKNNQLLESHALAQAGCVADHQGRELLRLQPHAGKCVTVREDQHGIETGLLQHGGEQQGRVQAGSQPGLKNGRRGGHLLPMLLEALRWLRVAQPERRHRRPDGGREFPTARPFAGLVAVHTSRLASLSQRLVSRLQQAAHRRVVRQDERREQLGHGGAAPFGAGQQLDGQVPFGQ